MNISRRNFLRLLFCLPAAPLLVGRNQTNVSDRNYLLNSFHIAGFRYYRGPHQVGDMRPGEMLKLVAEPSNAYDPSAVRIERKGEKLGYVPRSENRHLSRLLLQKAPLTCRVNEVRPSAAPWKMVEVEVGMRG